MKQSDFECLKGKRILVVDDMKDNQTLGRIFLQKVGASVEVASNGAEAIEKALKESPDAILMDIHMPVMDGLSATSQLRCKGFQKPIIAITADCRHGVKERAFESGVNGYLSKPLTWVDLLRTLEKFCARNADEVSERLH